MNRINAKSTLANINLEKLIISLNFLDLSIVKFGIEQIFLFLFFLFISQKVEAQMLFEDCSGKQIESVSFNAKITLHREDLERIIFLRPDNEFSPDALEDSLKALRERKIFSEVNAEVSCTEKVKVNFNLKLIPTVTAIEFKGAFGLDEKTLQRTSEINLGNSLNKEDLAIAVSKLKLAYKKAGYYSPEISAEIFERYLPSQQLVQFIIKEGYLSRISTIGFDQEFPQDTIKIKDKFLSEAINSEASDSNIEKLRNLLILALRKEGYLEAVVEIKEQRYQNLTGDIELELTIKTGKPISIYFVGNKVFSSEELIKPLKLESRTVPFTAKALQSLSSEIVTKYQQSGYFFSKANFQELNENNGRTSYKIEIIEGPKVPIATLRISGNTKVPDQEIKKLISTKERSWFLLRWRNPGYLVNAILASDLVNIEAYYALLGYPQTNADFNLNYREEDSELEIEIVIKEGDPVIINEIEFSNDEIGEIINKLPNVFPSKGSVYKQDQINNVKNYLEKELSKEGYPQAKLQTTFEKEEGRLKYNLNKGLQIKVGKIIIAGNIYTRDKTILETMEIKEGDLWNKEQLDQAKQSLYRLGVFGLVSLLPKDGNLDSAEEDLLVLVQERDTVNLGFGLGFNSEDGIQLLGEIDEQNMGGVADNLTLAFEGYFKSGERLIDAGRSRVSYVNRNFLDTSVSQTIEGYAQFSVQLFNDYSYDRIGSSVNFGEDLSEQVKVKGGVDFYWENLYDLKPDMIIGPHDTGNASYTVLKNSFIYDLRDDLFNPRQGFYSLVESQVALDKFGSDANFWGISLQENFYTELLDTLVWANGIRISALRPFGDDQVIPLSQRIFLGGRNSVRGFSRNSIGPRGSDNDVVGGDTELLINSELQLDLSEQVTTVLFFDAGSVSLKNQGDFKGDTLSIWDLKCSPGIGLNYRTPVGPLSISWGFPINDRSQQSIGRINIGIGYIF